MNNFIKSNFHSLLILGFALICFHFLWINPYSLKWDMAEQYLPWRYFLGKSLQNGEIPFWNPFQLGGYPSFADPQSGFWYYPSWIIGGTIGYSMRVIELEVLAFIMLAGLGFYKFLKKLEISNISSWIFAISYMCSGFIVGNTQHLTWIAAAAWLPWLFYLYLSIRNSIYNTQFIWFLIVLYLFVSSSYPAFVIVSAYILFTDQLYMLIKTEKKLTFIFDRILLLFACVIILFPIIYSVYTSQAFFSRGDSLSIAKVLQHPFSYQSLLSLITPFASFKNPTLFKTDISMSNAYIGLFPVVLLALSIMDGSIRKNYKWLILAIIFLLIGFGDQTPLRTLLYNYIPGFNLFRFPALFRLFFIASLLIFTAKQFDSKKHLTKQYLWFLFTILSLISIYIFSNFSSWHAFNLTSLHSLAQDFEKTTFIQHVLFQLCIQGILIITTFYVLYKQKPKYYLLIICCIDLFLSVRLNAMATMVLDTRTRSVDELITHVPSKFTTPKLNPLNTNIDQRYEYRWPLNWNMNCYFGEIAIDGYNPFVLKTFNTLSESSLKDSIWENSWYYFPNTILLIDTPTIMNSKAAWVKSLNNTKLKDTLNLNSNVNVNSILFTPNNLDLKYSSNTNSAMVYAQNPFKGWNAYIDGESVKITTVNIAQQMIFLPKGQHEVKWLFRNSFLQILTAAHLLLFVILILFGTIKNIRNLHI